MRPAAVLLDLDGTLVDTAPDMVAALNRLLAEEGLPPAPYAQARNQVSNGSAGMIRLGFTVEPEERPDLIQRFLDLYFKNLTVYSRLFNGLESFLNLIHESKMPWGIVTNKPAWLTEPLMDHLGIEPAPGSIVSGDALPQRKPHPAPLQLAATQLEVPADGCVYIGDAARDIQAGRAAGMTTVAAHYGYIPFNDDPYAWNADHHVRHPSQLADCIANL